MPKHIQFSKIALACAIAVALILMASSPISPMIAKSAALVYVDYHNSGNEDGSSSYPFNSITEGVNAAANDAGQVLIYPATYGEPLLLDQPMVLQRWGQTGSVVIDPDADTDGDGLLDRWELFGYDDNNDGVIDVDLPAMGARHNHKDLFVEADYMTGGGHDHLPDLAHLNDIVAVFNDAPVSNPDGTTGISIHIDTGGAAFGQGANTYAAYDMDGGNGVAHDANLGVDLTGCDYDWGEFQTLKDNNFAAERVRIFHYMIFAHNLSPCLGATSGISRNGFNFTAGATDFIVSLGGWTNNGTQDEREGTFAHELGHNLGLRHGGSDHLNWKPNYLSVMNYRFQNSGVYRSGSWAHFDYSRFLLPTLDETSLNEATGLGSTAGGYGTQWTCPSGTVATATSADANINWNCDFENNDASVAVDVNWDGDPDTPRDRTLLGSQDNWANITFAGGGTIVPNAVSPQSNQPMVSYKVDELTFEMYQDYMKRMQR